MKLFCSLRKKKSMFFTIEPMLEKKIVLVYLNKIAVRPVILNQGQIPSLPGNEYLAMSADIFIIMTKGVLLEFSG